MRPKLIKKLLKVTWLLSGTSEFQFSLAAVLLLAQELCRSVYGKNRQETAFRKNPNSSTMCLFRKLNKHLQNHVVPTPGKKKEDTEFT